MAIEFLLDVFAECADRDAIVWRDASYGYDWLRRTVDEWIDRIETSDIRPGSVVALEADFSPVGVAVMLALVEREAIVVPLTKSVETQKEELRRTAEVEFIVRVDDSDTATLEATGVRAEHELIAELRERGHPGVVLFSSGSSGAAKAVLHDFTLLLEKYTVRRHAKRTITFFLFDHIGGLDTLLYTLSNGACVITVADRAPESVCAAVERHRAEVLPVSPTFINLLLISGAHERHDLSSLEVVTYGTEVMPESTLARLREILPDVRTLQKYGLSEVGTLRSRSKSSESCWVKIGGEGYDLRVVDGLLEIKARSAMLGYLNAPSPFTEDGWLRTGDSVEVDGEYFRILGRRSEIINVGGEKFHPTEVENVLLQMDGVTDVIVGSEPNPLSGQLVVVQLNLDTDETRSEFRKRMRAFCADRMPAYKIPQKVVFVEEPLHSRRFKKLRVGV